MDCRRISGGGVSVTLYEKTLTGQNAFGEPVYTTTAVTVDNVLVAPSSETEILDATNLYGKKSVYTLAIPKSDTHDWTDKVVEFWGEQWHVFGYPTKGIDALVPLDWNMKVQVERYG